MKTARKQGREGSCRDKEAILRILVVDDHAVVRKGIQEMIRDEYSHTHFAEAHDGATALDYVEKAPWDMVILDLNLPGRDGFEILKEIKLRRPNLPVLILSMYDEEIFAVRAITNGASGYLSKGGLSEELLSAIRHIRSGRRYISPSVAEHLAERLSSRNDQDPHELLSDREFQVLRLIAEGKRLKDVANVLSLSPKTISTYKRRLLEKMGMTSVAELSRYAVSRGLIK